MTEENIAAFLSEFDDNQYPIDFLADYELIECLAQNEQSETLLVKERQSGSFQIAKCYSKPAITSQTSESELLRTLNNERLPAFIAEYQDDGMLCVLREYVEGQTLDKYVKEHIIDRDHALSICRQICEDLIFLHNQNPPVIHRDLKPQNIIMDQNLNPRLIDFGNSRLYDENAQTDTVHFGTRYFAAPEQYGFSQTDGRTDIFALGVLLGWLLSGEVDVKKALEIIKDYRITGIIKKCTAFSPDHRYATAEKLRKDLIKVVRQSQTRLALWIARVTVCVLCLILGFSIGRFTEVFSFSPAPTGVHFIEPLIEQAVRLQLGLDETAVIETQDLLNVSELYIFGNHTLSNRSEFEKMHSLMENNDGSLRNGGITSLEDLTQLKNLKTVSIALQAITDISPLKELPILEEIELKHNLIQDVSPLTGSQSLRNLFIFENPVSDLTSLANCPHLEKLDIGSSNITSLSALQGLKHITSIYAAKVTFDTIVGIDQFSNLQEFYLSDVVDDDLTPLMSLPNLKTVFLDSSFQQEANNSLSKSTFEIIYR